MICETQRAWLAGIIEGEGHIGWNTNTRKHRVPVVQISMVDEDIIRRAATLMHTLSLGPYGPYGKDAHRRKPHYRVGVYGRAALAVLRDIRPWLGERRGQKADEMLTWTYHAIQHNPVTGRIERVA